MINADLDAPYWELVNAAQKEGSFLEMCKTAIWTGNVANMGGCSYMEGLPKPQDYLW